MERAARRSPRIGMLIQLVVQGRVAELVFEAKEAESQDTLGRTTYRRRTVVTASARLDLKIVL